MNKIYFISGVSGVGKTSTISHLKETLSPGLYDIHDLDERGVPDGGGREWLISETRHWLEVGKTNALNGQNTIICGFANPELLKTILQQNEDIAVIIILLHASPETLRMRLQLRHSTPESIKEIERASAEPVDKFIENNIEFSSKLRQICEENQCPIIDTNNKMPVEVAQEIVNVIASL
jgi:broad-specificity NMP kinase